MQKLNAKIAVITGAASGIGYALADQALREGMAVVIADIDNSALCAAVKQLQDKHPGADVRGVVCDVSKSGDVQKLHDTAIKAHGAIHLLINNAGVGGGGKVWDCSEADWDWVIDINLKGVIHGCRIFAPSLIASGDGYIVNTASIAGLMSAADTGPYTVSKHGVVALSEVLAGDFAKAGAKVGVSVLCPSFVNTDIAYAEKNRSKLQPDFDYSADKAAEADGVKALFDAIGLSPAVLAEQVFDDIKARRFYLFSHPQQSRQEVTARMDAILNDQQPPLKDPGDFPGI